MEAIRPPQLESDEEKSDRFVSILQPQNEIPQQEKPHSDLKEPIPLDYNSQLAELELLMNQGK